MDRSLKKAIWPRIYIHVIYLYTGSKQLTKVFHNFISLIISSIETIPGSEFSLYLGKVILF